MSQTLPNLILLKMDTQTAQQTGPTGPDYVTINDTN